MNEFKTRDPMATNSMILKRRPDGTVRGIYCHYDGDLGHTGRILYTHYRDPRKVEALIDLGFIEVLGENIDPDPARPHTEAEPQPTVTLAYHRDMDQEHRICTYNSITEFDDSIDAEHANYYYRDGMWMYREAQHHIWMALTRHLIEDYSF